MAKNYSGRNITRAVDILDLRAMAKRRLPKFVFEYLDGGAEDELTMRNNSQAFKSVRFARQVLRDVTARTLTTDILGQDASMPCIIAPTGFNGLYWRHADIALAKAAKTHNIPFTVSTVSSDSLHSIAKEVGGRLWFQLYVLRSEQAVTHLINMAKEVNCEAMMVTLDASVAGNRCRDRRSYARPLSLSLAMKLNVLTKIRWLFGVFLPRGLPGFGNLSDLLNGASPLDGARYMGANMNASLNWSDIERLRDRWASKLILKGIVMPNDVERAAQIGIDGVVISNHGGRQLDGEPGTLELVPEIVDANRGRMSIFLDGGIRRGSHVAKAVALGVDSVLLGRATAYGVAAAGVEGASKSLDIIRNELDGVLGLLGCDDINNLDKSFLV